MPPKGGIAAPKPLIKREVQEEFPGRSNRELIRPSREPNTAIRKAPGIALGAHYPGVAAAVAGPELGPSPRSGAEPRVLSADPSPLAPGPELRSNWVATNSIWPSAAVARKVCGRDRARRTAL
jgi:hypothetical protein